MDKTHKKGGKTSAKSYGLNAVLTADEKDLILTRGTDGYSKVEQSVTKNNETSYFNPSNAEEQTFEVDARKPRLALTVMETKKKFEIQNPLFEEQVGQDALGFKDKLETEMFGRTFPKDNIHVQIAYNVLDIKKILGLKMNDIIFCLRNLQRVSGKNKDFEKDLVGFMNPEVSWNSLYDKQRASNRTYIDRLQPYAVYFDNVFKFAAVKNGRSNPSDVEKSYANSYDILRILSFLRQSCVHGCATTSLFTLSDGNKYRDLSMCADGLLNKSMKELNDGFCKNSDRTLLMLFEIFSTTTCQEEAEIIKAYYEYVVLQDNKNVGISLKTIREQIVDAVIRKEYKTIQRFSNDRAMINKLLDYVLYDYYKGQPELVQSIIDKLVACRKADADSEDPRIAIYKEEAERYMRDHKAIVSKIRDAINLYGHAQPREIESWVGFDVSEIVERRSAGSFGLSPFAKYVYVACRFLDGKEVNELTTSLCNKFENMVSLIRAAKAAGVWTGWSNEYSLFNDYTMESLANQFRIVKTLAGKKRKMKKIQDGNNRKDGGAANSVTRALWADAINLFKDNSYVSYKGGENETEDNAFYDIWKKLHDQPKYTNDKGKTVRDTTAASKARNLIKNTVINNRRFVYIIKFFDPRKCHQLVNNKEIMSFVLGRKDMPMSQIVRYYAAITKQPVERLREDESKRKLYVSRLVDELSKINLETIMEFGGIINRLKTRNPNDYDVQKARQLVSLYLTVLYVVVKGLVHVNSLYALGWSSFDRDHYYRFGKSIEGHDVDYLSLTKDYMDTICPPVLDTRNGTGAQVMFEGKPVYRNSRVRNYLTNNIQEAEPFSFTSNKADKFGNPVTVSLFREYRNKTEHNDMVSTIIENVKDIKGVTSYYDIYQYGLQRYFVSYYDSELAVLIKNFKPNSDKSGINLVKYLDDNKRYQKDFVKMINMPFAYCMARYKNLTISALFNDEYNRKVELED